MKHDKATRSVWVRMLALALLGAPTVAHASELVYTPVNPNQGNRVNGQLGNVGANILHR